MVTRRKKYAKDKFDHPPHPKDGYPLLDYKDSRARRLLDFFVPIFYPKNPVQVTFIVGNTIFGAYTGEQEVDWALVMRDMVRQLLARIGKSKPTPICPYLPHLYIAHDAVQPEDKVYMVRESFMRNNIKPDEEEQPDGA